MLIIIKLCYSQSCGSLNRGFCPQGVNQYLRQTRDTSVHVHFHTHNCDSSNPSPLGSTPTFCFNQPLCISAHLCAPPTWIHFCPLLHHPVIKLVLPLTSAFSPFPLPLSHQIPASISMPLPDLHSFESPSAHLTSQASRARFWQPLALILGSAILTGLQSPQISQILSQALFLLYMMLLNTDRQKST